MARCGPGAEQTFTGVSDEASESPVASSVTLATAGAEAPGVGTAIAVAGKARQAITSASTPAQLGLDHARALDARITDVRDAAIGRVWGPGIPLPLSARLQVSLRDARSVPTPYQHDRNSSRDQCLALLRSDAVGLSACPRGRSPSTLPRTKRSGEEPCCRGEVEWQPWAP